MFAEGRVGKAFQRTSKREFMSFRLRLKPVRILPPVSTQNRRWFPTRPVFDFSPNIISFLCKTWSRIRAKIAPNSNPDLCQILNQTCLKFSRKPVSDFDPHLSRISSQQSWISRQTCLGFRSAIVSSLKKWSRNPRPILDPKSRHKRQIVKDTHFRLSRNPNHKLAHPAFAAPNSRHVFLKNRDKFFAKTETHSTRKPRQV